MNKIFNNFHLYDQDTYDFKPFIDEIEERIQESNIIKTVMDLNSILYLEHNNTFTWVLNFVPKLDIPNRYGAQLRVDFKQIFESIESTKLMVYNRDLIFTILISGNK